MRANETGRSMIEMLGVLAIVGILSVGGLSGYAKAINQYKAQQTMTQINEIASRMAVLGDQTNSYSGLTNTTAIRMGIAPASLISDGHLISAFGSNVTIAAADLADADDTMAWTIEYRGLPKTVCVMLASQNWQGVETSSLIGLGVAGAAATNILENLTQNCNGTDNAGLVAGCPDGSIVSLPLTPEQAVKGCSCTNDTCKIALKFF